MQQSHTISQALQEYLPPYYIIKAEPCFSQIGSGALPVQNIPSFGIAISSDKDSQLRALSKAFRLLPRPVIGRLNDKKLFLDLRCLDCEQEFIDQMSMISELLE
jgi:L-seryl-tRNA(Ser) seleniumtransferase